MPLDNGPCVNEVFCLVFVALDIRARLYMSESGANTLELPDTGRRVLNLYTDTAAAIISRRTLVLESTIIETFLMLRYH